MEIMRREMQINDDSNAFIEASFNFLSSLGHHHWQQLKYKRGDQK